MKKIKVGVQLSCYKIEDEIEVDDNATEEEIAEQVSRMGA